MYASPFLRPQPPRLKLSGRIVELVWMENGEPIDIESERVLGGFGNPWTRADITDVMHRAHLQRATPGEFQDGDSSLWETGPPSGAGPHRLPTAMTRGLALSNVIAHRVAAARASFIPDEVVGWLGRDPAWPVAVALSENPNLEVEVIEDLRFTMRAALATRFHPGLQDLAQLRINWPDLARSAFDLYEVENEGREITDDPDRQLPNRDTGLLLFSLLARGRDAGRVADLLGYAGAEGGRLLRSHLRVSGLEVGS